MSLKFLRPDTFYFMRLEPVDIKRYLPQWLNKDPLFSNIQDALNIEHENYRLALADLASQIFIETTSDFSRWEQLLKITPAAGSSDDLRRAAIRAKRRGGAVLTVERTKELLANFAPRGEVDVRELGGNKLELLIHDGTFWWDELMQALMEQLPAHLAFDFEISRTINHPMYVGLISLLQGWYFHDQRYREKIIQPLRVAQINVNRGVERFDICGRDLIIRAKHTKHTGISEFMHGKIRYGFDNEIPDEDTAEKFERYLLRHWAEFQWNPVVEQYRHGLHGPEAEPIITGDITRKIKHKLRIGFGELIRGRIRFTPDIPEKPPEDITQRLTHTHYSDISEQVRGEISYDIGDTGDITQRLTQIHRADISERMRGEISYDLSDTGGDITQRLTETYHGGIFEGTSGEIRFGDAENSRYHFAQKYGIGIGERAFGLIRYGLDGFEGDDDEDFIPIDRDFLRLYWKFPTVTADGELRLRLRTQTILDPREDIKDSEIKSLSKSGADGEIFVWGRDKIPTTGIERAVYVRKKELKII